MAENPEQTTTLREYLTKNSPEIKLQRGGKQTGQSTAKKADERGGLDHIDKWDDFNIDSINGKFGSILDCQVEARRLPSLPQLPKDQLVVANEPSFEGIIIAHTARVLNTALEVGAELWSKSHTSANAIKPVYMLRGAYFRHMSGDIRPDWGAKRQGDEGGQEGLPLSLICGDTKFFSESQTMPVSDLEAADLRKQGGGSRRDAKKKPTLDSCNLGSWMKQVHDYAAKHETRFCYIIHPLGVYLFRRWNDLSPTDGGRRPETRSRANLEIQPPPPLDNELPASSQQSQESQESQRTAKDDEHDSEYAGTQPGEPSRSAEASCDWIMVDWEGDALNVNLVLWTFHMLAALGYSKRRGDHPIFWNTE